MQRGVAIYALDAKLRWDEVRHHGPENADLWRKLFWSTLWPRIAREWHELALRVTPAVTRLTVYRWLHIFSACVYLICTPFKSHLDNYHILPHAKGRCDLCAWREAEVRRSSSSWNGKCRFMKKMFWSTLWPRIARERHELALRVTPTVTRLTVYRWLHMYRHKKI